MNNVEQYILKLPDDEKIFIINGYESFVTNGVIGDEPIRMHAENLMVEIGAINSVSAWMIQLAFEAYRFFGKQRLAEIDTL